MPTSEPASPAPAVGLPSSPLIEIRATNYGGRGVFARTPIAAGTLLHTADTPSAHVLFRVFRHEACPECFAYNAGRRWRVPGASGVLRLCSKPCRDGWEARVGEVGLEAWAAVEGWLAKRAAPEPDEMRGEPPSEADIDAAWAEAERAAAALRGEGKARRKAEQDARAQLPYPDALFFLLTGFLTAYADPELFAATTQLVPTARPYDNEDTLRAHVAAYVVLLALAPTALRPHITAASCRALVSRDAHNSFGIWSQPEDDGAEFLGFGIWPTASFFNHSCEPSVVKRRDGRAWVFTTARDVDEGEELCISYLGHREVKEWDVTSRQNRLKNSWDFECGCTRCIREIEQCSA
jgi:hypothetical protein